MPKKILFIMCDQLRYDYLGCTGTPTSAHRTSMLWQHEASGLIAPMYNPRFAAPVGQAFIQAAIHARTDPCGTNILCAWAR
jgi:arylsulfatase A-like enzyme